jgi:hypothetical protein
MKTLGIMGRVVAIGLLVWLMSGCASGLKAYQKGNYYKASMQAAARLRSKPDNEKAQEALSKAYPLVVETYMRRIDNALTSKDLGQLDMIIGQYDELNVLASEILTSPGALSIIPNPKEYHEEMRLAKEMVAELSYQEGLKAMSAGTLEQARVALQHFLRVNQYISGYKDVASKIEQATYAATMRVIVQKPVTNAIYSLNADFFYNRLMEDITRRTYRDMVRFYTPEEAKALKMTNPHEYLVLNFEDFTVGNSRETSDTFEALRDSVLVGTTKVNGRNQDVYGTVKAKVTVHRMEIMSRGILSVRFVEPSSDRVTRQRNFAGQSVWVSEWAGFNGDERALTKEQIALINRKPLPLPPPQELFASFATPLYEEAAQYIGAMY